MPTANNAFKAIFWWFSDEILGKHANSFSSSFFYTYLLSLLHSILTGIVWVLHDTHDIRIRVGSILVYLTQANDVEYKNHSRIKKRSHHIQPHKRF